MKKNQITIQTFLSCFSGLCLPGVFLLFFGWQSAPDCSSFECISAYTSGSLKNDVAAVYRYGRKSNFSGSKNLTFGKKSAEYLSHNNFVDFIALLSGHRSQAIGSVSNLNCEFIASAAPSRASPCRL